MAVKPRADQQRQGPPGRAIQYSKGLASRESISKTILALNRQKTQSKTKPTINKEEGLGCGSGGVLAC